MTCEIRRGLSVTTDVAEAAEAFVVGIDQLTAGTGAWQPAMAAAHAADPEFVLARLALSDDGRRDPSLRACLADPRLGAWERSHLSLCLQRQGTPTRAWALRALAHMQRFPADAWMYEKLHGYVFFFGGAELRALVCALTADLVRAFPTDVYYRSRWSFCLTETGFPQRGLDVLGDVGSTWPEAASAWHCRVHALHGLDRHDEVAETCAALRGRGGKFEWHLSWHESLVHLGRGDTDEALRLFDASCGPQSNRGELPIALADVAGFVWAFMVATGGPPPRLPALTEYIAGLDASEDPHHLGLQRALLAGAVALGGNTVPTTGAYRELVVQLGAHDWTAVDRALARLGPPALREVGGSRLQRAAVALVHLSTHAHQGRQALASQAVDRLAPYARTHPVVAAYLREVHIAA